MKHCKQSPIARQWATVILLLMSVCVVSAQELEYKMELGGMLGGCSYMGDANRLPLHDAGFAGGILARYNINPRMAVKGDLAMGRIKGTTKGLDNKFPDQAQCSFSRELYELNVQFEYSFFAYGTGAGYKDSHRLSPYLSGGLGLTYAPQPSAHVVALNIPMGIGVKYKVAHRINVGGEWNVRCTTSDRLDVTNANGLQLDDPYGIKSKGMKNKDCYSQLVVYVTYDLFPKYRKCNN